MQVNIMVSTKVALLLLGAFALAAVASADSSKGGKADGGFWESKGWEKVPKDMVHDAPKPPKVHSPIIHDKPP